MILESLELDHHALLTQDFALLNPLDVDASLLATLEATPLGLHQFDCDPHVLPQLVCLRDVPQDLRLEWLDLAEARAAQQLPPLFGALIQSQETMPSLTARLGKQLLVKLEHSDRSYFFRYSDARVFQHLPRIFTEQQLDNFIWPASAWTWFDSLTQTWRQRRVSRVATGLHAVLSISQIDALARVELLNRTVLKLQSDDLLTETPSASLITQLDALLRQAIVDHAFGEPADQIQYAVNAVKFGAGVHQMESVRDLLAKIKRGDQSYIAGMHELATAGLLTPHAASA